MRSASNNSVEYVDAQIELAVGRVGDVDADVVRRGALREVDDLGDGVAQVQASVRTEAGGGDGEPDLEQRVATRDPCRAQRVDDQAERDVLVSAGADDGVVAAVDQLGEAGVAGQVGPQDDGAVEVPHKGLEVGAGAPGDHGSDRQVDLIGVVTKDGQQRGVEDGQYRGLLGPRVGVHAVLSSIGSGRRVMAPAPVGCAGRGRSVGKSTVDNSAKVSRQ